MKLIVHEAFEKDVYRDIARVPEVYRQDSRGDTILQGSVRRVRVGLKSTFVILRGDDASAEATVRLDDKIRDVLGVQKGQEISFDPDPPHWYDNFLWGWNATEIGYQTAMRIAVISAVVSIIGLGLGLIGLSLGLRK